MIRFLSELFEIVRPFGLKRLVLICGILFVQAIAQTIAVFSVVPFLKAAADMPGFRLSTLGHFYLSLLGGGASDQALLALVGGGSMVLLLAGNLVTLFADARKTAYAYRIGHQVRLLLISRLLERRYEYFLGLNSSLLTKHLVEDVAIFSQAIVSPFLDVVARALLAALLILSILILQPVVTLVAAAVFALYFLVVIRPVRRVASRTSDEMKLIVRSLFFEVAQTLSAAKPILADGAQSYFRRRCEEASRAVAQMMPRTTVYPGIPRAGLEVLIFGGLIGWVLIALAGGRDIVSIMPQVGLTALIAYRLTPSLQLVLHQSLSISMMRQSMDEVLGLLREQQRFASGVHLDGAEQPRAEPLAWSGELRFEGVGFAYQGTDRAALQGVDLVIHKGERVAFVGPTGSGKSTLVDLILGLLEPTEGGILLDGVPLERAHLAAWRATVGYVPQELFLLDASIAENIAFGSDAKSLDQGRVEQAALMAQAGDFIESAGELGLWSGVGERGVRLSGGQRQRLGLARALYKKPSLLVLDEATSALDPQTEKRVVEAVSRAASDLTIITVAHRLSTVERCDRIYFVRDGRISACGTYAELLSTHPEFQSFAM